MKLRNVTGSPTTVGTILRIRLRLTRVPVSDYNHARLFPMQIPIQEGFSRFLSLSRTISLRQLHDSVRQVLWRVLSSLTYTS
jgi:hypothetical protein